MNLYVVNQGGPDEEFTCVSSQVCSSQTAFRIHHNFLPYRSGAAPT